jgi:hypothetical protein
MDKPLQALMSCPPPAKRTPAFNGCTAQPAKQPTASNARWLFLAARALGMDAESARVCEQTLVFPIGACRLAVCPLDGDGDRWWCASSLVPRPTGVEHAAWLDALLAANAVVMPHTCIAFALDQSERAMLVMRMPDTGDSAALAAELRLFGAIWSAVGAWALLDDAARTSLRLAEDSAVAAAWHAQSAVRRFEAAARSTDMEKFLLQSLRAMGASAEQAVRAVDSGRFRVDEIELTMDPIPDGVSLLLGTALPAAVAQVTTARAALQATAALLPSMGAALARDNEGLQVLANWSTGLRESEDLARYVLAFAVLPQVLEGRADGRVH